MLDSRLVEEGRAVRRKRECSSCGLRFLTQERPVERPLWVVKRDGRREGFSREKLVRGMEVACAKRPVPREKIWEAAAEVEREVRSLHDGEVSSALLGEMVLHKLRDLDEVAYLRFASVYLGFEDAGRFQREVEALLRGRRRGEVSFGDPAAE